MTWSMPQHGKQISSLRLRSRYRRTTVRRSGGGDVLLPCRCSPGAVLLSFFLSSPKGTCCLHPAKRCGDASMRRSTPSSASPPLQRFGQLIPRGSHGAVQKGTASMAHKSQFFVSFAQTGQVLARESAPFRVKNPEIRPETLPGCTRCPQHSISAVPLWISCTAGTLPDRTT